VLEWLLVYTTNGIASVSRAAGPRERRRTAAADTLIPSNSGGFSSQRRAKAGALVFQALDDTGRLVAAQTPIRRAAARTGHQTPVTFWFPGTNTAIELANAEPLRPVTLTKTALQIRADQVLSARFFDSPGQNPFDHQSSARKPEQRGIGPGRRGHCYFWLTQARQTVAQGPQFRKNSGPEPHMPEQPMPEHAMIASPFPREIVTGPSYRDRRFDPEPK
jgi:hypothetical protein